MHRYFILAILLVPFSLIGQKSIQIERLHSPKTIKYYSGDEITFQLKDGQWYTRYIYDVSLENNWIQFRDGYISLEEIQRVRSFKNRRWSRPISTQLILFPAVWASYRAITIGVADDAGFGRGDYWIMGGSFVTGVILRFTFNKRDYRINNKQYRLRVIDLNIK